MSIGVTESRMGLANPRMQLWHYGRKFPSLSPIVGLPSELMRVNYDHRAAYSQKPQQQTTRVQEGETTGKLQDTSSAVIALWTEPWTSNVCGPVFESSGHTKSAQDEEIREKEPRPQCGAGLFSIVPSLGRYRS